MISPEVLSVLGCPWCLTRPLPGKTSLAKGELTLEGPSDKPTGLKCRDCGRVYRIQDGIPNFLVEDAIVPKENK